MIADDKNYETYILKQVINSYLDKILSANDEETLNTLLYKCDDLVWKIATEIYSQSGHKVEFSLVRDIANSRIEPLKIRVAEQKAEQARLRAIQEARRAEAEAQRKAMEQARRAEAEAQRKAMEHRVRAIEEALGPEEKTHFLESGGDVNMFKVFLIMKEIIIEQLEVEPDDVTLDSNIFNLGADDLDGIELIMALEEAFDL